MQAPAVPQPSDQQLQRFASASQKVSGVVDEYRPKVESAKTDEAKQKLVKEADEKMVQLVRADGLTVDEIQRHQPRRAAGSAIAAARVQAQSVRQDALACCLADPPCRRIGVTLSLGSGFPSRHRKGASP